MAGKTGFLHTVANKRESLTSDTSDNKRESLTGDASDNKRESLTGDASDNNHMLKYYFLGKMTRKASFVTVLSNINN